ncbi:MAG: NAD(P)-binding domain-containing protein, partial [Gammaproteobacteria bacterium]
MTHALKTGFIGLGAIGYPMALNLHKAGLLAAAYNRTSAKAKALAKETRCLVAKDIAELAKQCDAVVICVSADQDVMEVVDQLAKYLKPAALVIDCSTVSAATARTAAQQ